MKKLLLGCMITMSFGCLVLGAACGNKEPDYYALNYSLPRGVTVACFHENGTELKSGTKIRSGYTVTFRLSLSDYCEGTPAVYVNNTLVSADGEGKYSFTMSADTTVSVQGVSYIPDYTVEFARGADDRIWYEYDGNESASSFSETFAAGDTVRFKMRASVYYTDSYSVLANTEVLKRDDEGYYSFKCTEDTRVSVYGLQMDTGFFDLPNGAGGSGTEQNPYHIRKPIDLFYMASLINNDWYEGMGFQTAYYRLENDIDLEGEQLYVIGDGVTSTAYFGGNFNGNGKKISNFVISDAIVDQEDFNNIYIANVGMFGYVMPMLAAAPQIYNLTLDGVTMDFAAANHISADSGSYFYVGGIAGVGVGAQFVGCSVNGRISVRGSDRVDVAVGGLVGHLQSQHGSDGSRYYAVIRSCSANVDVVGTGNVYAAGGLAGNLVATDNSTNAFILNSYATGSVSGMNAGGLVGYMSPASSVISSYATGNISAKSDYSYRTDSTLTLCYANAGGLVGFADCNTVLSDSFFTGSLTSDATENKYQFKGTIYGKSTKAGEPDVDSRPVVVLNCPDSEVSVTKEYIKNTLLFSSADWLFTGEYPTINHDISGHNSFTVSLHYGTQSVAGKSEYAVTDEYMPMSYWYMISADEGGIPEYVATTDGLLSYGYYFDADRTLKVPYSYIPVRNVTLHVAFADYSAVVGTYYFPSYSGVSLELLDDGAFLFRGGALTNESRYTYDGEQILLTNCGLSFLSSITEEYVYTTYRAYYSDGTLTISDNLYFPKSVKAQKALVGFKYGSYRADNGAVYTFMENGRGTLVSGNSTSGFSFTVNGTALSLQFSDGEKPTGTMSADGTVLTVGTAALTPFDAFAGKWQTEATLREEYVFDGSGNWTYRYYTGEAIRPTVSKSGTYTVNDGTLTATGGLEFTATRENAVVTVTKDGAAYCYYPEDSYVGVWRFSNRTEPVSLELKGLNEKGVGVAVVTFNASQKNYDAFYDVYYSQVPVLYVYSGDFLTGVLLYDSSTHTLCGSFYSENLNGLRSDAVFYLEDMLFGVWETADSGVPATVSFNGKGLYDAMKGDSFMSVYGLVSINGNTYRYLFTRGNPTFTVAVGNDTYSFSYDRETDTLVLSIGDEEVATYHRAQTAE